MQFMFNVQCAGFTPSMNGVLKKFPEYMQYAVVE